MNLSRRFLLISLLRVADLVLLGFAVVIAAFMSNGITGLAGLDQLLAVRLSLHNIIVATAVALVWHAMLQRFGFYRSHRLTKHSEVVLMVLKGVSLCTVVLMVVNIVHPLSLIDLAFLNAFWFSGLVLVGTLRYAFLLALHVLRSKGRNLRNILIIGSGEQARQRARLMVDAPLLGYRVVGFVDERWCAAKSPSQMGLPPLLCSPSSLANYLRSNIVDEVLVCLPMATHYEQIADATHVAEEQGVLVRVVGDVFDLRVAQARLEDMHGEPVLTLCSGGMHRPTAVVKELLDFALATVLLVAVSPLMLLSAVAVKLTSRGPVLYAQERLGLNKRRFKVMKFRTMVSEAGGMLQGLEHLNEQSGPVFKIRNDPRVTPVGRTLRKLSIDELPQLFNVLKGDMSLVGARWRWRHVLSLTATRCNT